MTLLEYEALLVDMATRKVITIDDATVLLQRFMAGDFDEGDFPVPLLESKQRDDDEWLALFALFLPQTERRISQVQRERRRDSIRQQSDNLMVDQTVSLVTGNATVREWHEDMIAIIGGSMLAQWQVGRGRIGGQPNVDINEQLDYLYRFGGDVHARNATERPYSADYLANRSILYGGAAWAAYYMGNESETGDGFVSHYIAADDRKTCSPCRNAVGYYLPSQGPWPGQICYGGGRCRCRRVLIYDPVMAAQLMGVRI